MTTAWWLTVLCLAVPFAFLAGCVFRAEQMLARRVTGRTIEFDRKRLGT